MRHRAMVSTFSRKSGPRKALLRGLVRSLVLHGRIETTLAKAKELRRHVERAVTIGKKQSVHCRRILYSRYPDRGVVTKLVDDISLRFKDRPGGYTRVLKKGMRPGDKAEMAWIEFVDFDPHQKPERNESLEAKKEKKAFKAREAKRKKIRLSQGAARRVMRRNLKH